MHGRGVPQDLDKAPFATTIAHVAQRERGAGRWISFPPGQLSDEKQPWSESEGHFSS
jgi:hypothetical protein